MGGHAAFIWPAYIAAAVLLTGLLVLSFRAMRQREQLVRSLRASRSGKAEAAASTDKTETKS